MWNARTKTDLIIEVWEKLDCENVGAVEIEAIETVVGDTYGRSAVDSPMAIARLLADEGAELRHSEVMDLYIVRASNRPYDAALRNILKTGDLGSTARSIANLENLRQKYKNENNKEGLRLVRETGLQAKLNAAAEVEKANADAATRQLNQEIVEWLRVWLETPEMFETWVALRQRSPEFISLFKSEPPA